MAARKTPGSPKPDKLMRDAIRLDLHRFDEVEINGKRKKTRRLDRVVHALVNSAIDENVPAIREIIDRMDGKVPQAIVGDDSYDPIRTADPTDEQRAKALAVLLAKTALK